MTRRSQPEWLPPSGEPIPVRRGPRGSVDPFYVFENRSRPGKPAPAPKRELQLLMVLGSKAALTVMGCVLVIVVATVLVLLVTRV
jgi:hypothetical protein